MTDIIEILKNVGCFKTFIKVVQAADLVETLKGPGPFTLFAINEAGFEKMAPGVLDSLLKDPLKLRNILLYQIIPYKLKGYEFKFFRTMKTLLGQEVSIRISGLLIRRIFINDIKVTQIDIYADNGIIHVIDNFVIPK